MTNLSDMYLNWLIGIVSDDVHTNYSYLCGYLLSREFYWSVKMDENRAEDGLNLRSIFADQTGIHVDFDGPCTVLEMMIALSVRGAEDILWDGENNWTPFIFWSMIENLKLLEYTDDVLCDGYSNPELDRKIDDFLNRNYEKNGDGSLFKLSHFPKSAKNLEIWYQMQEWICEHF